MKAYVDREMFTAPREAAIGRDPAVYGSLIGLRPNEYALFERALDAQPVRENEREARQDAEPGTSLAKIMDAYGRIH